MNRLLLARLGLPARINGEMYDTYIDRSGNKGIYKKPHAKHYEQWTHLILQARTPEEPWRVWQDGAAIAYARMHKPRALRFTVCFYFKHAGSDIDGPLKSLLDTISRYLAIDDHYIYELAIKKYIDRKFERVELSVEDLGVIPPYGSLWDTLAGHIVSSDETVPELHVL